MGYTPEERTKMQVANAREAEVEKRIPARTLSEELRRISAEDRPAETLKALEEAGLLPLFSAGLAAKMNHPGLQRLEKAAALLPDDVRWRSARFGTFLFALTEKLSPKEKAALVKTTEMPKADVAEWQKLEARAKKLETALKAARVRRPSHVYQIVSAAAPDEVLFTLYHSSLKAVQERLRNHFGKYLQQIAEITPEEWALHHGQARHAEVRQGAGRLHRPAAGPASEEGGGADTNARASAAGSSHCAPRQVMPAPLQPAWNGNLEEDGACRWIPAVGNSLTEDKAWPARRVTGQVGILRPTASSPNLRVPPDPPASSGYATRRAPYCVVVSRRRCGIRAVRCAPRSWGRGRGQSGR